MGLYQRSVLKNYLSALDDGKVNAAYNEFKTFFFNPVTQQNIRNSKEEQFQEGFLRELFVKIMGYTLNPDANYNLISEQKNVSDAKKADGAILINGKVVGVIELKGTNTIDLGKIQQQAFYYLSAHPEAVYVITSNFEKLRFYIQKSNDYEEFNLFTLTLDEFKLLYLCTSLDSISFGLPLKIKQESLVKEDVITKQLYKDYSSLKSDLFSSLCDRNSHLDKLTLFKATQKLIDRFLFIFFCEDNNGLLPANSIGEIIKHWNKLREMDEYKPLYDIFKKYFEYINSGRAAAGDKREIFAYNGGLFAEDVLLDKLDIDDNLLYTHTQKLSAYDFISEVDVNILGHIFEHSLNDIEEIQAEIAGNVVDKSKTKRKKDGVFYTPKYITEYIVENTVGKLCADKKAALEIDEDLFVTATTKAKREPLLAKLNAYKSYLLSITICDPACGSGAFLNQAYVFLQKEHQYVADLESKLFDAPMVISDVSADILENNLFGVDINEESVEIARLALWLRSAKKGRKLNNLSNNIKCGNSLIDDPEVAGDKAFNWEKEFPQVFRKKEIEGFHVVLTTHNSRTSQRMLKLGIVPSNPVELNLEEEIILTEIIASIAKEKNINILAYNICMDHVHMIITCEQSELNDIVKTIKGKSSFELNKWKKNQFLSNDSPPLPNDAKISNGFQPIATNQKNNESKHLSDSQIPNDPPISNGFQHNDPPIHNEFQPNDPKISNGFQPIATNQKINGLKPIGNEIGEGYNPDEHNGHLWSQKYFRADLDVWQLAELSTLPGFLYKSTYLDNAQNYIYHNREKHQLPEDKQLKNIITQMIISEEQAFAAQYAGGFDVVIGNPPYVFARDNFNANEKSWYVNKYESAKYQINTYLLFIEKTVHIIKNKGIYGLIIPNAWLMVYSGEGLRKFLLQTCTLNQIINLEGYSFESANVETVILLAKKQVFNVDDNIGIYLNNGNEFYLSHIKHHYDFLKNDGNEFRVFIDDVSDLIISKLTTGSKDLDDLTLIKAGLKAYETGKGTPKQTADDVKNRPFDYNLKFDEDTLKYLDGKNVGRYILEWTNSYLKYGDHLAAPRTIDIFNGKKIIVREITGKYPKSIVATFTNDTYLFNMSNIAIVEKQNSTVDLKFILVLLNSNLMAYYFIKNTAKSVRKLFPKIILNDLRKFPIKSISFEQQQPFIEKADNMLYLHQTLNDKQSKFISRIQINLHLQNITGKLEKFYENDFKSFVDELKKQKVILSLKDQDEWEDYFNAYKQEINTLQAEVAKTDEEIDQMVYELYGLTDDEIRVVEGD